MSKLQVSNEIIINAPVSKVWEIITDIALLPKINPGVISATGIMNKQGEIRTCEIMNNGKQGTIIERLAELVPEKETVWVVEKDTMGMTKMLKHIRFCFKLDILGDTKTKLSNESYYEPANFFVKLINAFMLKRQMSKIQDQILNNIKSIAEN